MKCKCFKKGIYHQRLYRNRKEIKQRLVDEYGKCYWCGIKVFVYPFKEKETPPDDEATLDHLKSKNMGRKRFENTPKVLCCRKCNGDRAKKEIEEINNHERKT